MSGEKKIYFKGLSFSVFQIAQLAYNWSIHENFGTRKLQMLYCIAVTILFINCAKEMWVETFVDAVIKLAHVMFYGWNWVK